MATSLLDLPTELRLEVYKYFLVPGCSLEPSIEPIFRTRNFIHPEILSTNSTVFYEAREVLYSANVFDFIHSFPMSPDVQMKFLEKIGTRSAWYLRHVCIDFPGLQHLERDEDLSQDSVRIFSKLTAECVNLRKIEIGAHSAVELEEFLAGLEGTECERVLATIDSRFKAMPSKPKVIIQLLEELPIPRVREQMKNLGWTIKLVNSSAL
ncbi:hypothetical protein N7456_006382 [Penicillium angulare]|uniref:F-box domain-containing protein n=1 Tax=Penicillium angulare TaxID=116970 RepID=A0A9W9FHQ0_9EURO|nr:hypothetical protein N7456_006382 [Penicillium angulare]